MIYCKKVLNLQLKSNKNSNLKSIYRNWLSSSQNDDVSQVINLSKKDFNWIIDHYGISKKWHKKIKKTISNILVIDDIASKSYDCNIILNQNYNLNYSRLYLGKVSRKTKQFLGPEYAILDSNFKKIKKSVKSINKDVKSVFVYFGGEDNFNLSKMTILALSKKEINHLQVNIVLPQKINIKTKKDLISIAKKRGKVKLISPKISLDLIMSNCDIAIGAGGSTLWERIHLELPSIIISTAKNQEMACIALSKKKIIDYLGEGKNINQDKLSNAVINLISNKKNLRLKKIKSKSLKIGNKFNKVIKSIK